MRVIVGSSSAAHVSAYYSMVAPLQLSLLPLDPIDDERIGQLLSLFGIEVLKERG